MTTGTTTPTTPPAAENKAAERPKTAIDGLHSRVDTMFGVKNGMNDTQLAKLNGFIDTIADNAGLRVEGYKAYKSDMDAVLRMIKRNGMLGVDLAAGNQGKTGLEKVGTVFAKTGVDKADFGNENYLKVLAGTVVSGFVQRSNAPQSEKNKALHSVDAQVGPALDGNNEWKNLFENSTKEENVDKARNPTFNGNIANGALRVGLGAIAIKGIMDGWKGLFRPKESGEKNSFFDKVSSLLMLGAAGFVGYQMAVKGKGFQETFDTAAKPVVGAWTKFVQGGGKGVEFNPVRT